MRRHVCSVVLAFTGGLVSLSACLPAQAQGIARPISDDVVYQIMPIAWRDSDNDTYRYGDFGGLTASLDYLQNLGITAVYINPIFQSPAYHGFHHYQPDHVNASFGTEAQFWTFVSSAHARGIKVFLDFVAYGVNRGSSYFTSAYQNPSSPYDSWLAFTNSGNSQFSGSSYTTWDGTTVNFIDWDMRTSANSGACRNQVITWCRHWVDPNNDGNPADGIDGFRADHVLVTNDHGPGGWGYNLGEFWTPWHNDLRTRNPNLFTIAEQADWGSIGSEFLPVFNSALGKQVMFAIRSAANSGNVSGVYSTISDALATLPANAAATNRTYLISLGDHDVNRFMSDSGDNIARTKAAAAIVLTQPMTPLIYFGDELGMRGVKATATSDAADIPLREPFKWNRIAGAPMTNYFVRNAAIYNARFERDNDGRSVEEQQGVSTSLLEANRSLITIRRNSSALRRGSYTPVTSSSSSVFAFLRQSDSSQGGPEQVLVAISLGGSSGTVSLNLSSASITGGTTTPQMLTGSTLAPITNANKAAYTFTMPAYGIFIARVGLTITPPPPPPAPPVDIDGRNIPVDAGLIGPLGTASATQTCATGFGDNLSELNRLFVRASPASLGGFLRLGITGNIETNGNAVAILIETGPGGQNTLDTSAIAPPPDGVTELTGTILDTGFAPNTMFFVNPKNGILNVDQISLPAGGAASKVWRGRNTPNTGAAALIGGTNPNNLAAALDNTNTAGVTGSSVAAAATAATGLEMLIPYRDLAPTLAGLPCGTIRISAFLTSATGYVSNQFLPGLPLSTTNLTNTPNLAAIAGSQFLSVAIRSAADFDNGTGTGTPDGGVGVEDLLYYLDQYDAGLARADLDDGTATGTLDGGIGIEDLLYYLSRYDAGC